MAVSTSSFAVKTEPHFGGIEVTYDSDASEDEEGEFADSGEEATSHKTTVLSQGAVALKEETVIFEESVKRELPSDDDDGIEKDVPLAGQLDEKPSPSPPAKIGKTGRRKQQICSSRSASPTGSRSDFDMLQTCHDCGLRFPSTVALDSHHLRFHRRHIKSVSLELSKKLASSATVEGDGGSKKPRVNQHLLGATKRMVMRDSTFLKERDVTIRERLTTPLVTVHKDLPVDMRSACELLAKRSRAMDVAWSSKQAAVTMQQGTVRVSRLARDELAAASHFAPPTAASHVGMKCLRVPILSETGATVGTKWRLLPRGLSTAQQKPALSPKPLSQSEPKSYCKPIPGPAVVRPAVVKITMRAASDGLLKKGSSVLPGKGRIILLKSGRKQQTGGVPTSAESARLWPIGRFKSDKPSLDVRLTSGTTTAPSATGSPSVAGTAPNSPARSLLKPPSKAAKRGKSSGREAGDSSCDDSSDLDSQSDVSSAEEAESTRPPRMDGRQRRSAAPKSFKKIYRMESGTTRKRVKRPEDGSDLVSGDRTDTAAMSPFLARPTTVKGCRSPRLAETESLKWFPRGCFVCRHCARAFVRESDVERHVVHTHRSASRSHPVLHGADWFRRGSSSQLLPVAVSSGIRLEWSMQGLKRGTTRALPL